MPESAPTLVVASLVAIQALRCANHDDAQLLPELHVHTGTPPIVAGNNLLRLATQKWSMYILVIDDTENTRQMRVIG